MSPTIVLHAARRRAAAIVTVLALTVLAGISAQPQAAHAATLTPTVSTTGTLYTGSNTSAVNLSFVVGTSIPSGGSLWFNSDGFDVPGCQTYPVACSDFTISASSSSISSSTITTLYNWGGNYHQFKVALSSGVAAGETITFSFPATKISIGSTSAWYRIATYSTMVNTNQVLLNMLDDSSTRLFNAVNPPSTVTFDSNGGNGSMSTQTASTPTALTLNAFTRAGYEFDYWSDQQYPWLTYTNGASYSFSSNATLVANWVPVYTVNYDSHGGTAVSSGTFRSGGSIATLPSAPTRTGYQFVGWFAAATGGSALANGYTPNVTQAITLHAQWSANSYAVTYDSQGGSAVSPGSFSTGGSLSLPSAPTKSGYNFLGWFAANSGGAALASPYSPGVAQAVTLYAHWALAAATITFDANGGTGSTAAQTGSTAGLLNSNGFTRAGYGFSGWNTAANGTGASYSNGSSYPFLTSATLYAQWRLLPATPIASVDIQVPVGATVANAPVALDVDGLKDQTGYTVTVHSTPQVIDQGIIWSGRLNKAVALPAGLESGWHRLVIDGTAADGSAFSETFYFKVSPTGTLLTTSATVPAELASTGANGVPISIAGGLLTLGALVLAIAAYRRRVAQ